jgi:hypothetical protein
MRRQRYVFAALVLVSGIMVAQAVGCVFSRANDCEGNLECTEPGSGTAGSGGGTPAGCVPSENKDPVEDTCGVFVSSKLGADENAGTKSAPVKTLQQAVDKAKGRPVYACAEDLAGSVMLASGSDIYGGLDCTKEWAYVGATKKSTLVGDADKPAVVTEVTASGASIADFTIQAADAIADGGSSIAMLVDGAAVGLTRCDLVAGRGKAGAEGDTPMDPVGPTNPDDPMIVGNKGNDACMSTSSQLGGDAKENAVCPAANGGPIGGAGGQGAVLNGGNGDVNPATMQTALGGVGQPSMDPMNTWDCVPGSGLGNAGAKGAAGGPGVGAKDTELGTLDKTGYVGVSGQPGSAGRSGQGGGGGGGAKGKTMCAGASGGGGGAGGCGGKGGTGGKPGGSSIGLVSLNATLTFDTVTIKVGTGGSGGDGGDGQGGGSGGKGGTGGNGSANGLSDACDGGKGGQGGQGDKGGGGRGGHAIGIAYTGTSMPSTEGVTFTRGTPGPGGKGADAMHDGDPGVQADVQVFP